MTKTKKKPSKSNQVDVDLLLDFSDMTVTESNSSVPLLPVYSSLSPVTSTTASSPAEPYRVMPNTEFISDQKFPLIEVPYNFSASYRFPRINEDERTLVEVIFKNEIKLDEQSTVTNNRIQIQGPSNGSVVFKNLEVQTKIFFLAFTNQIFLID